MVKTLKCLTCGGDLQFNPTLQKWKCEWCDSEFVEKDLGAGATDDTSAYNTAEEPAETLSGDNIRIYNCNHCGAEVVTDNVTSATFCVYCQRPVVLVNRLSGEFKPSVVIPFHNTKDKAKETFKNYLKKKRFLPDAYKDDQNIEKLTGVYIPFWIYKGDVSFNVHGEGDIVSVRHSGDYRITKTDIYQIAREGKIKIDNIPVDASTRTPDDIMDSIEPFDFSEIKDFSSHYLSGFLAERYDEDKEKLYDRAKIRFEGSAENKIKDSLTKYSAVRRNINKKRIDNLSSKYGLLPVWLLYSNYKNKQYIYAMNGQSGKMIGNLPVDGGKVFKFGAIVFAISGILGGAANLLFQILL